jgi:hypothetical protein
MSRLSVHATALSLMLASTSALALGVLAGAGMSALMYLGLLTIPARHLFSVTSSLIT